MSTSPPENAWQLCRAVCAEIFLRFGDLIGLCNLFRADFGVLHLHISIDGSIGLNRLPLAIQKMSSSPGPG